MISNRSLIEMYMTGELPSNYKGISGELAIRIEKHNKLIKRFEAAQNVAIRVLSRRTWYVD